MNPVLIMLGIAILLTALGLTIMLILFQRLRGDTAAKVVESLRTQLREGRGEASELARAQREELLASFRTLSDGSLSAQDQMRRAITESSEKTREGVALAIKELQAGNEKKLDEMRTTVDEKLQGTLEKRLGESFALVSERLEAVQRGLGEMQQLAGGVGDLKRVLGNVSTRGAFGELQLRAILEQLLAPEQYVENFQANPSNAERVEFAIRLPGRDGAQGAVYLPVDSKFPQEDYLRLLDAGERADAEAMKLARAALVRAVRAYAKEVASKYVRVPVTTDFAIIFLPTEGLYAEVLRERGVVEELQGKHGVTLAGPTTMAALLNALQMGFRTLAIEQRSGEVWTVLGAVKAEFSKFGAVLDKVKKQLDTASNTIEDTTRRTRAMERKLRDVTGVTETEAQVILGLEAGSGDEGAEGDILQ